MYQDVYIVVPAKDEGTRIGAVLQRTIAEGFENVVVVNDGSSDDTAQVAEKHGAYVLNHLVNLGPGAATQTGINYALQLGAGIIVTMDADGQHFPKDLSRLVTTLREGDLDMVIGSRFLERNPAIPWIRRSYNRFANLFTAFYTGVLVSDSQSGMKAMHARFARKVNLRLNGYEFCTEFIHLIRKHKAAYTEIPIGVIYSDETMRKGQSFWNGVKMLFGFIRHRV